MPPLDAAVGPNDWITAPAPAAAPSAAVGKDDWVTAPAQHWYAPAGGEFGDLAAQASAPPSPQGQVGADINAVGQGLVGGTGAVIAGAGRGVMAAAAQGTQRQLAVMDAIDQGKDVPQDQDVIGYQFLSPEQRAKARSEFTTADDFLSKREPDAAVRAGMAMETAAPSLFPVAPGNEGIQTSIGRTLGNMGPALLATAAGSAVGGPAGGVLAGAAAIGSQAYDGTYQEAIDKGATPEEAEDAAGKSAMGQIVAMSLPIGKVIPLIPVPLRDGFVKTLVNLGQQGIEIGGGSALSRLAQNYVAQSYDSDRPLTQGVAAAGLEGTVAGLVIRGGGAAIGAARATQAAPDAVAAIGNAPNIDGAIVAAGKAAATPASADATVQPESSWGDLFASSPADTTGATVTGNLPDQSTSPEASPYVPITASQVQARDGVGFNEADRRATAENAAATAPQSVGAAASSDLDPGVGALTPAQELAYRSTAEGQKLLEPQPYGALDNTAYIAGVTPNGVDTAQTVEAARELKMLKTLNPDVAEEAANISASNSDARQRHFEQVAGSDVDVTNAIANRNAQMDADTQAAWANKTAADIQPVVDDAAAIMQTRDGRRPLVRNAINSVLKQLYDDKGEPIADPEILYGVGDHINDLLAENDAGGQKKNGRASAALMQLKNTLYDDVIEPAAPGFQQALDNYHQASIKIDEMTVLQKHELKLFDANNRMTYGKVQAMMRQIVDSRQAPGLNPYKSISDDTMAKLWDLRDDLRRAANAENLARTPGGSDTAQNAADVARETAKGVGSALIRMVPGIGPALNRGQAIAQPILEARAARARTARGMEILHPETPAVERPDQPPPAAPAAARPVAAAPPAPDLFNRPPEAVPAATPIEREQAAIAAMKSRAEQARTAEANPPATAGSPQPGGNLYGSTTALTPAGNPVAVRYVVREASDLTPSQLPDGRPNPAFPPELQPRDRTRAASMAQVTRIANTLKPDFLGYAGDTSTGAPIIGPDGVVESGNGRTMAIQKAYADGSPEAEGYRAWLAGQGFDVAGMREPVLVRERTAPLDMPARARLADEMGASPTMAMSASERAAADARRIPTDVLSLYQSGDVTSPRNAAFVRAFADHAIPAGEQASFMTADGELSAEGATRVRNALTQRAYGNNALVTLLAENADPDLKAFGGALVDAGGPMAKLRGAIESGAVSSNDDITPGLVEAANIIQTAKRARISLADAVAQIDAFAPRDPWADRILAEAYGDDFKGRMSRPKLAHLLSDFAERMQIQSGLFGDNKTASQVFDEAAQQHGNRTRKSTTRTNTGGTSGLGPGTR